MILITGLLFTSLLGTAFSIEWSFPQWNGFTTSTNKSSSLFIYSRENIITCCVVCANVPECLTVVLNSDNCICNSELIPHASQVDNNTSVFVKRPKSCFAPGYIFINNMCIKVSTDEKTWHEAKLDCENTGGNLIVIDSLEKHRRLYDMFSQYFDDIADRYFVGATDIEEEGTWKWIKGNSSSYMDNGFFNNGGANGQDCGAFKFDINKIVDRLCDRPQYYICELVF